jgi:hypothetical protein
MAKSSKKKDGSYDRSKKHLKGQQLTRNGKLAKWFTELSQKEQKSTAKSYLAALKTERLKDNLMGLLKDEGVL